MNIPDNIGWLEDLAVHSLEHGNTHQASRLWEISKWIADANELMTQQSDLLKQLHENADGLLRANDYLQNRLATFGI